ncbi:serine--tRNA ligase [Candidatus Woesearchaeota archaeon]|nr:serine--tRNA ligase [Candidatus Woesearchaeota archaeon]MBT4387861.1 serine--tRNA ligase [Candidatus Woesearchaeota archaeon]MBT4595680.1 serine--tRNA ligase [Candidatus Woesearchaeota archaeon]MBT5740701.1 serine--tRNA ligase [Candidatus Woesearchaeota archaeon]MBT7296928.1 serine--tRNA ligase [Candidatus Woesearchaeota archaeon]
MININFLRENIELVKKNIKNKFKEDKIILIDKALDLDSKKKKVMNENQKLRAERNNISKEISKLKKEKKDISQILKKAKDIPEKIKELTEKENNLDKKLKEVLIKIPNIMHKDVPIGKNESENVEIKKYLKPKKFNFDVKAHQEIADNLGLADFDSSSETSGSGFYYLEGDLALLNQALVRYTIEQMVKKDFTYVETPYLLRGDIISGVVDLHDQKNMIYKIDEEDLYLIGTSEHSLIGRFLKKDIDVKKLPIKQTSFSMCFRKEKGSHGLDERGLFRTHQFNKVEMVVICDPEDSMKYFKEMKKITNEIFNSIGIPTRDLAICSGDLGDLKHIQYDVEGWSPRRNDYIELGSCSNLTDAQSLLLDIRVKTGSKKYYPHILNNTAIATSRALVLIIENFQDKDGNVVIPKILVPYMFGKKIIKKI